MPKTDFLRNWWRGSGLRPEPNGAKPRRNMGIAGQKAMCAFRCPRAFGCCRRAACAKRAAQGIRLLPPGGLRQTGGLPGVAELLTSQGPGWLKGRTISRLRCSDDAALWGGTGARPAFLDLPHPPGRPSLPCRRGLRRGKARDGTREGRGGEFGGTPRRPGRPPAAALRPVLLHDGGQRRALYLQLLRILFGRLRLHILAGKRDHAVGSAAVNGAVTDREPPPSWRGPAGRAGDCRRDGCGRG